jgi:hypothetical protein
LGTANNSTARYGGTVIRPFHRAHSLALVDSRISLLPRQRRRGHHRRRRHAQKDRGETWLTYGGRPAANGILRGVLSTTTVLISAWANRPDQLDWQSSTFAPDVRECNPVRYSGAFLVNFCGGTLAPGSGTSTELLSSSLTGVYSYGPIVRLRRRSRLRQRGRDVTLGSPLQGPPEPRRLRRRAFGCGLRLYRRALRPDPGRAAGDGATAVADNG